MQYNVFYWIEASLAFFLFLLMIVDYKRNKEIIFKYLAFILLFIAFKSVVYLSINIFEVKWVLMEVEANIFDYSQPMETLLKPLYNFKIFIFQYLEMLFIIGLVYIFILKRRIAEKKNYKKHLVFMWIQIGIASIIGLSVIGISLQSEKRIVVKDIVSGKMIENYLENPDFKEKNLNANVRNGMIRTFIDSSEFDSMDTDVLEELEDYGFANFVEERELVFYKMYKTYESSVDFIEALKSNYIFWVFIIWKLVLLVFMWITISSIHGYVANILNYISKSKKVLFSFLFVEFIFYIFSLIVYQTPLWVIVDIVALIFLSIFAIKVHLQYITNIEMQVETLSKAKDIIISLMKDISAIIGAGEFELDVIIKQIVDSSVKGVGDARGGTILMIDPAINRLVPSYVKGMYPPTKGFRRMDSMTLTENVIVEKFKSESIAIGEGLLGKVAEDGDIIYIPDALNSKRYVQSIPDTMMVTSFIAVPLKSMNKVFGVLSVVHDDKTFFITDLSLIETLGEQAAITIKQIQMYQEILEKKQAEKEIGVAGEIQASLIPHTFPETDKYNMYAFSIPAKGVGGDYYDYIDFGNNKIAVTMFDVSGKGVPAGLIMVMIRSILRTIATLEEDTKDILTKLNSTISAEIVEDRYATGFYLLFDAERGIMNYTNAGHGPLVLYRALQDKFELLDTEGMPIGIMQNVVYGQDYTTLEKGDIAILYTDGISEAMNEEHDEFGMERMYESIRNNKLLDSKLIANNLLDEVNEFVGNAPQHDDETLLILKMK